MPTFPRAMLFAALLVLPFFANTRFASADEYIGWAVGDVNMRYPQPRLMCPEGMFISAIEMKHNEWLGHVQIFCNPGLRSSASRPAGYAGPEGGGDGGDDPSQYRLDCGFNFVDGLTGLNARVFFQAIHQRHYAADLHVYCGGYGAPGQEVKSDPYFRRSGSVWVTYQEMNAIYPDPGTQALFHCPPNWAAIGLWYALQSFIPGDDDIGAVGVICGPLPQPEPTVQPEPTPPSISSGAYTNRPTGR